MYSSLSDLDIFRFVLLNVTYFHIYGLSKYWLTYYELLHYKRIMKSNTYLHNLFRPLAKGFMQQITKNVWNILIVVISACLLHKTTQAWPRTQATMSACIWLLLLVYPRDHPPWTKACGLIVAYMCYITAWAAPLWADLESWLFQGHVPIWLIDTLLHLGEATGAVTVQIWLQYDFFI